MVYALPPKGRAFLVLILAGIHHTGANIHMDENSMDAVVETTETDNSAESSPEQNQMEQSPSSQGEATQVANTENEDNLPFHKHPRFKALIEEKNKLQSTLNELLPLKEEIERLKTQPVANQPARQSIPQWFTSLYGENQDAWSAYQSHSQEERKQMMAEIKEEFKREQQREAQESQKWNNWIEEQLTGLKDEGKQFERNEFLKFMRDYSPVDAHGNYDFKKGFELYELKKQSESIVKNQGRKSIATATMSSRSGVEPKARDYVTPKELREKGLGAYLN